GRRSDRPAPLRGCRQLAGVAGLHGRRDQVRGEGGEGSAGEPLGPAGQTRTEEPGTPWSAAPPTAPSAARPLVRRPPPARPPRAPLLLLRLAVARHGIRRRRKAGEGCR